MTRLLRILFPRTCRRIENEGYSAGVIALGRLTEKQKRNFARRHPRGRDGKFSEKVPSELLTYPNQYQRSRYANLAE